MQPLAFSIWLMICMLLASLVGTASALAQQADYDAGRPEPPDDPEYVVRTRMCRSVTDGCNGMSVSADFLEPKPPVRGRFFLRGALLPPAGERHRLAALLALEQPYDMRAGPLSMMTLLDCPRRHKWRCHEGSLPLAVPRPPLPNQEGPPSGPEWFGQSEIHASWIDLTPRPHGITCLTLDYIFVIRGSLRSRRGDPRGWECI